MTVSKFLQSGRTYLPEAAQYLEKRGLTIQDTPISTYQAKNFALLLEDGSGFIPEGWAYQVKGPDGEVLNDQFLIRVCNWPENTKLFRRRGDKLVEYEDRPKFLMHSTTPGAEFIYYCCPASKIASTPIVMLHEKVSSAALSYKALGIPSLAVSGCAGWSSGGRLKPGMRRLIEAMAPNAKLVACFDGDILDNPNIKHAASQLKGWVGQIRPDIEVRFPMVPENPLGVGWDDWAMSVDPGLLKHKWLDALTGTNVDVLNALPTGYLIDKYLLTTKEVKNKVVIEHSTLNYLRLANFPMWRGIVRDINGQIYDLDNLAAGGITYEHLITDFKMWLEEYVFSGDAAGVRRVAIEEAWSKLLDRREVSIPLYLLEQLEDVSEEEARAAALRLITEGIKVNGPMPQEESVETILRMARDMCSLWSTNQDVDVQWVCALVGPSGCGKSNFPISALGTLSDMGYPTAVAKLAKEGSRASIEEYNRQTSNCLASVFDEYDPSERNAKEVGLNLFTLSSSRTVMQRAVYGKEATPLTRHSALFITTTDKNRTFIRTGKNTGERRFIVFEVEGVIDYHGSITSNRTVIKECWRTILRHGYNLFLAGDNRSATEFSEKFCKDYVDESANVGKIGRLLNITDSQKLLEDFGKRQYRPSTDDIRFSYPQFSAILVMDGNLSRNEDQTLKAMIIECGAVNVGQGRVNANGKDSMKDNVFVVPKSSWGAFVESFLGKF